MSWAPLTLMTSSRPLRAPSTMGRPLAARMVMGAEVVPERVMVKPA